MIETMQIDNQLDVDKYALIPAEANALKNETDVSDLVNTIENVEALEKPPLWFQDFVKKAFDLWFDPKSFESEELYEKIGIKTYKKYLPTGEITARIMWKYTKKNAFIAGSSEGSLRSYEKFTRIYETIHITMLSIGITIIALNLAAGDINSAICNLGMQTLVNVYPVILQRYNRLRLYGAMEQSKRREANKKPLKKLES